MSITVSTRRKYSFSRNLVTPSWVDFPKQPTVGTEAATPSFQPGPRADGTRPIAMWWDVPLFWETLTGPQFYALNAMYKANNQKILLNYRGVIDTLAPTDLVWFYAPSIWRDPPTYRPGGNNLYKDVQIICRHTEWYLPLS